MLLLLSYSTCTFHVTTSLPLAIPRSHIRHTTLSLSIISLLYLSTVLPTSADSDPPGAIHLVGASVGIHVFNEIIGNATKPCPLKQCRCGTRLERSVAISYIYCGKKRLRHVPRSSFAFGRPGSDRPKLHDAADRHLVYDELILNGNRIERLEFDSFSKTVNVKYIDLSSNPLVFIHPDAFKPLHRDLTSLKIGSSNSRAFIVNNIDWLLPLRSLKSLQLSGLDLSDVSTSRLSTPIRLQHLTFQHCTMPRSEINGIDNWPFLAFEYLKTLTVDFCHGLNDINIPSLPMVEKLSLVGDGLESWDRRPVYAPRLTHLDLSLNRFTSFRFFREMMPGFSNNQLKWLSLRYCQITGDEASHSDIPSSLETLVLDYNPLVTLFTVPESIVELSLRSTSLRTVQSTWFQTASSLKKLNLHGSDSFTNVECDALAPVVNKLMHLDLGAVLSLNHKVDVLCMLRPFVIADSHLEWLSIRNNHLELIPKSIERLRYLHYIDVSDNNLHSIDLSDLPSSLKYVILNNATGGKRTSRHLTIDSNLPSSLETLHADDIHIAFNPAVVIPDHLKTITANKIINCDCSLLNVIHWLSDKPNVTMTCDYDGEKPSEEIRHALDNCSMEALESHTSTTTDWTYVFSPVMTAPVQYEQATVKKEHDLNNRDWNSLMIDLVDPLSPGRSTSCTVSDCVVRIRWIGLLDSTGSIPTRKLIKGYKITASTNGWMLSSPLLGPLTNEYTFHRSKFWNDQIQWPSVIEFCLSVFSKTDGVIEYCKNSDWPPILFSSDMHPVVGSKQPSAQLSFQPNTGYTSTAVLILIGIISVCVLSVALMVAIWNNVLVIKENSFWSSLSNKRTDSNGSTYNSLLTTKSSLIDKLISSDASVDRSAQCRSTDPQQQSSTTSATMRTGCDRSHLWDRQHRVIVPEPKGASRNCRSSYFSSPVPCKKTPGKLTAVNPNDDSGTAGQAPPLFFDFELHSDPRVRFSHFYQEISDK